MSLMNSMLQPTMLQIEWLLCGRTQFTVIEKLCQPQKSISAAQWHTNQTIQNYSLHYLWWAEHRMAEPRTNCKMTQSFFVIHFKWLSRPREVVALVDVQYI
jgi:hypothetical protein